MFSEEERQIFPFERGDGKTVYGDPLAIHRRLNELLDYQAAEVCKSANSDVPPVRDAARKKLAAAAMEAFKLPPFDEATGKGCTEPMAIAVLGKFIEHREDLKKKTDLTPSPSPPSPALPPGFYPESPTTPPSSVCT